MTYDHFDFPTPHITELREMDLIPYRSNERLREKIYSLFSNHTNPYHQDFLETAKSGSKQLIQDMSIRAIAIMRYFEMYPQQFNNSMEYIELQILVRMWKQVYKHKKLQRNLPKIYMPTKKKLLKISDPFFTELVRTVREKDYIHSQDEMVKVRYEVDGSRIPLREQRKLSKYYSFDINELESYE